jgi:NAD(P)-dependent dehydrogenase (short-subunit alcohol dehydrogenase family)
MPERQSMTGKIVAVTGAGSGLGEATANAFQEAGSTVVWLDWNRDALARLEDRAAPPHLTMACDVSDEAQVAATIAAITDRYGRVDIVVNCAAVDHTYWVEQLTVAQWDQIIAVNLRGPFLMAKAVWPQMRAQGGGHIVNIASTSAIRAASGAAAYTASKFGLLGLSRALNLEGRQDNIRVTTVIPGGMRTHFFDRFAEQGIPMPDEAVLQDPRNVANTIVFAAEMPPGSDVQEIVVTSPFESGWP